MHSGRLFVGPFPESRNTRFPSDGQRSGKRKREASDDEPASPGSASAAPTPTASFAALPSGQAAQFRVAGLAPQDDVPPRPFPHRPAPSLDDTLDVQDELRRLAPPLHLGPDSRSRSSLPARGAPLRHRHQRVLIAVLHRCLLEGDYPRASRAWAMLLRAEHEGKHFDVRDHGRWGIGAELLLRRHSRNVHGDPSSDDDAESEPLYSEKGFRDAKEYYERLILQYNQKVHPNSKAHPDKINNLALYPALFSLWIYYVSERSEHERRRLDERSSSSSLDDVTFDPDQSLPGVRHAALEGIRQTELSEARAIFARLNELLTSPPYDKDVELLRLRSMITLWITDLQDPPRRDAENRIRDQDDEPMQLEDHSDEVRDSETSSAHAPSYSEKPSPWQTNYTTDISSSDGEEIPPSRAGTEAYS